MNVPCLVLDLNPYWPSFQNNYMTSPNRLIGPFEGYMVLIVDMFKAIHNDTSEDEVLIDNYLNGSYLQLSEADQDAAKAAVHAGLDVVITLANIWDEYPGKARICVLDTHSRTLMIEFGGECIEA
ncbi:hypothetical protein pEaSNUABM37_00246 [Erwinia phage pEa_SNUABM_37]|nr:hypothetical protein pEaSNUABM37_00246 [Erwinia phage pEa_SNUABM_37]QXO10714.1 hypothetical protein pEaSNUABM48_00246 [Erwinia phage pEa_SNUABM_48]